MPQNFLVWLFDDRGFGVMEIGRHTQSLITDAKDRAAANKNPRTWISVLWIDEQNAKTKKLAGAAAGDSVYVLGHTNIGLTSLWSKRAGGEELKASDVAERLSWIDLPNVGLKLKVYSCFSAVSGTETSNLAASIKANLLATHANVQFFGYKDTVTDYQDGTYMNPTPHKWTGSGKLAARASSTRVQV
jgi:hypothetical protein